MAHLPFVGDGILHSTGPPPFKAASLHPAFIAYFILAVTALANRGARAYGDDAAINVSTASLGHYMDADFVIGGVDWLEFPLSAEISFVDLWTVDDQLSSRWRRVWNLQSASLLLSRTAPDEQCLTREHHRPA